MASQSHRVEPGDVRKGLALAAAWVGLSLALNLRWPGPEAIGWALLPSLDATVLLAGLALLAWRGRRLPPGVLPALVVVVMALRVFRFGDGLVTRYFSRPGSVALDLPTVPELLRLLGTTLSAGRFVLGLLVFAALMAATALVATWSIRAAGRSLAASWPRRWFAGAAALLVLVGLLLPRSPPAAGDPVRAPRLGAFAPSLAPRLARETHFALGLPDYRQAEAARIRASGQRLREAAGGISQLAGAHVFLFLVESYGHTVLERPEHARRILPVYRDMEAALGRAGFAVASRLLDSPTYAGRSWLAQATLATGIRAGDHVVDALIQELRPVTLAELFRQAGYRTVLAQPATTHRALPRWLYDFQQVYSAWDFDYRGPRFGFAPMPDQYVIDFVHRREVAPATRPLLITYALVSSHSPWNEQPPYVSDWSRLGDGRIFGQLPAVRFPLYWTNLEQGSQAYMRSLHYDLVVLQEYVTHFVPGQALVFLVGDHQPAAEVTGGSPSHGVPVHVISRNRALVARFEAQGYVPGMVPRPAGPSPGMETFLAGLLEGLATPRGTQR